MTAAHNPPEKRDVLVALQQQWEGLEIALFVTREDNIWRAECCTKHDNTPRFTVYGDTLHNTLSKFATVLELQKPLSRNA